MHRMCKAGVQDGHAEQAIKKGTDQSKHSQHFRALLPRRCGCGLAYKQMCVWFVRMCIKTIRTTVAVIKS